MSEALQESLSNTRRVQGHPGAGVRPHGALGAYVPGVTICMLKNLQGWTDRVEQVGTASVTLRFAAEDRNA